MTPITSKRYRTRATNFYRSRWEGSDPTSAQICAALKECAPEYVPGSFRVLKDALVHDQLSRENNDSAAAIQAFVNPVTERGSTIRRKRKPTKIRSVPEEDFNELITHLKKQECFDEIAAVAMAYILGTRPCEMRTVKMKGNLAHITGGKKQAKLKRGADRTLEITDSNVLSMISSVAAHMAACPRSDAAIRDRLRKECRALWPRRKKKHPTLKSFRHQLGATLKASDGTAEGLAYVMGHQSTNSISVYGNRRSGEGRKLYVAPAKGADLSKIRKPAKAPLYGRESLVGEVQFPGATRGSSWVDRIRGLPSTVSPSESRR
jgi:integrase